MPRNIAEDMVETVLGRMCRDKVLAGFLKNVQGDRLDREGIDFLIILNNGLAFPLQVKTSVSKEKNEQKRQEHVTKHPFIQFYLTINIHYNRESVYRYVKREIRKMIGRAMSRAPFHPPA